MAAMNCHLCAREAVARCFNCGALFCEEHGNVNCVRCETGIAAGDPRPDRFSAAPMGSRSRPGWWRPQVAEDYDPPACYECKGLARQTCRHCGNLYCPEHAGRGHLCRACHQSANAALWIVAAVFLVLGGLVGMGLYLQAGP